MPPYSIFRDTNYDVTNVFFLGRFNILKMFGEY